MAVDPVFVYIFCRRFVADGGLALGIFALLDSSENGNNERGSDAYRTGHSSFFVVVVVVVASTAAAAAGRSPEDSLSIVVSLVWLYNPNTTSAQNLPSVSALPPTHMLLGEKKERSAFRDFFFSLLFFTIIPSMRLFSMSFFRFRFIYLSVAFFFLAMTLDAGAASLDGWFS
jgi:hypothetical protein